MLRSALACVRVGAAGGHRVALRMYTSSGTAVAGYSPGTAHSAPIIDSKGFRPPVYSALYAILYAPQVLGEKVSKEADPQAQQVQYQSTRYEYSPVGR